MIQLGPVRFRSYWKRRLIFRVRRPNRLPRFGHGSCSRRHKLSSSTRPIFEHRAMFDRQGRPRPPARPTVAPPNGVEDRYTHAWRDCLAGYIGYPKKLPAVVEAGAS